MYSWMNAIVILLYLKFETGLGAYTVFYRLVVLLYFRMVCSRIHSSAVREHDVRLCVSLESPWVSTCIIVRDGLSSPPPDLLITIAPQNHTGGDWVATSTRLFWRRRFSRSPGFVSDSLARICVLSRCEGFARLYLYLAPPSSRKTNRSFRESPRTTSYEPVTPTT